ncbi:MAG: hypothetical protein ABI645_08895 [Pseudomonadota bacterium]
MRQLSAVVIGVLAIAVVPFLAASAAEPVGDQKLVERWLPRLAGAFRIDGSVELPGESEPLKRMSIVGKADCRRVGGVECFLDMTWDQSPDAKSTVHSATLLYAYDRAVNGIRYMQVDDDGVAEGGSGLLSGDTLVSTSPCARIARKCVSKLSVTAGLDLQSVKMELNMEVDGKRVGGYQLTLRREAVSP